jgi:hypothetical protein
MYLAKSAKTRKPYVPAEKFATISVLNNSTVVTDDEIKSAIPNFQAALDEDFSPFWAASAKLLFVPKDQAPPSRSWWIAIMDNSDVQDALGYHDLTNDGQPIGKVFAKTDLDNGYDWHITFTHELWEQLADPWICWLAATADMKKIYAVEVADAVEADPLAYKKGNTMISDFVLPTWFEDFWKTGQTQFDFMNHVNAPLKLAKGGYISIWTTQNGWNQEYAQGDKEAAKNARPPKGSRRDRRRTPREQWRNSHVKLR